MYQISWLAQGQVTKTIVLWSGELGVVGQEKRVVDFVAGIGGPTLGGPTQRPQGNVGFMNLMPAIGKKGQTRWHGSPRKRVFLWFCRNSLLMLSHVFSVIVSAVNFELLFCRGVFHTQLLTHMPATYALLDMFFNVYYASTCLQTHVC